MIKGLIGAAVKCRMQVKIFGQPPRDCRHDAINYSGLCQLHWGRLSDEQRFALMSPDDKLKEADARVGRLLSEGHRNYLRWQITKIYNDAESQIAELEREDHAELAKWKAIAKNLGSSYEK